MRCFLRTGRASVALCEINADVRSAVKQRYGLDQVYYDLGEAVNDRYDAAVICTPANLHVPMALQLAGARIPLLIEKPLSTNMDGVERLVSLVDEHRLVAAVAYVSRADPALTDMRTAIHSGRFGRPVQLVAVSGQHFPLYRPAYREIYYADRATGGGAIQDALTHLINSGQWLVGPITQLAADADHLVLEGVEVEDTVNVIARHVSILATYSLNQHQSLSESTITVICEQGTVRLEMHRTRWLSVQQVGGDWQLESQFDIERDDLFVHQANNFLDTMEGRSVAACSLNEGLQTLRVNLAVLAAAETRTWQSIG